MDRSVLANVAMQLQQVVSSLQALGGEGGDYGMQVEQPLPTWASIDARVPMRPYQPLVSREKHLIDLQAEMARPEGALEGVRGPDEYGMPQEDMGAALASMGVI